MIALTPRQKQILELGSQGATQSQMGEVLGLARNTVNAHIRLMFQNMGADNMAHAVCIGFNHGILEVNRG